MNVTRIDLDDDGRGLPETVLVRMTRDEALYLAKLTGVQSRDEAESVLTGGDLLNTEVYDSLTGELFNRFYDGGVDEAIHSR